MKIPSSGGGGGAVIGLRMRSHYSRKALLALRGAARFASWAGFALATLVHSTVRSW